jgi:hypothetical protein
MAWLNDVPVDGDALLFFIEQPQSTRSCDCETQ